LASEWGFQNDMRPLWPFLSSRPRFAGAGAPNGDECPADTLCAL
jgi:hypothetical protein